ncbi:MAG: hypothetical protein LBS26_05425 [Campylobacteraceae bacterium]|jgi:hypothetical protein|nr:hypothetical protein [Campylobacteraceae bacterium]
MAKLLFFLVVSTFLFGDAIKIEFLETRHIEALNEKTTSKGVIEIETNRASIQYFPPHERKITFENDTITTQTKNAVAQKSAKEEQNIVYMFVIFKAIFEKDEVTLKNFFEITHEGRESVLIPLSSSASVSKIIYSHDKEEIKRIELFFWDDSRITIDVVKKR